MFIINTQTVGAASYYLYGTNLKNYNGITNQKFWVADNTTQWQKQQINDAMYRWNSSEGQNIWTPMQIGYTSNKNNSIMDFSYSKTWWDGNTTRGGETTFWNWNSKVMYNGTPTQQWSSALIQFGGPGYLNYGDKNKKVIFTHEIGHGIGLAHNWDTKSSIMYPYSNETNTIRASYGDLQGVNALYK